MRNLRKTRRLPQRCALWASRSPYRPWRAGVCPGLGTFALAAAWPRDFGDVVQVLLVVAAILLAVACVASLVALRKEQRLHQELHRADRRRRDAEKEIRAAFYSIGDCVILTDAHGCVMRMNPAAEKLAGWTEAEALGRPLRDVFRLLDGRTRAEIQDPSARVLAEGRAAHLAADTLLVARDGTEHPIADSLSPIISDEGAVAGLVLVFRDQTGERAVRRALEAERDNLRALMASSPSGIIVIDQSERVVDANPSAEAMFARRVAGAPRQRCGDWIGCVNRHESPQGCGDSSHCPQCRLLAAVRDSLLHGQAVAQQEAEFLVESPQGQRRAWLTFSAVPVDRGGHRHAAVTLQDITQRKQDEEQLRVANARLQQALSQAEDLAVRAEIASRAKTTFLANMSHEIRTPMTAILGFAELLASSGLPREDQRQFVTAIERNAQGLMELLGDILDLSAIEAERLALERVPCDLRQLMQEVVDALRARANQEGVVLEAVDVLPISQTVRIDAGRVRHVLLRLVRHVVRLSQGGSVLVRLRSAHKADGSALIQFSVVSTGIGIPEDKIPTLFEPFIQPDSISARRYDGTGLGLAICKRLANALGGDIEVANNPGDGTTFTLTVDAEMG